MPKGDFRREGEKELTGKEEEPSELIYFKASKSIRARFPSSSRQSRLQLFFASGGRGIE